MTSTNPQQPDQRAAPQPARQTSAPADRATPQSGQAHASAANPHEEHVPEEEAGYGYGV